MYIIYYIASDEDRGRIFDMSVAARVDAVSRKRSKIQMKKNTHKIIQETLRNEVYAVDLFYIILCYAQYA